MRFTIKSVDQGCRGMCLTRFAHLDLKFTFFYCNMHAAFFYCNMHLLINSFDDSVKNSTSTQRPNFDVF